MENTESKKEAVIYDAEAVQRISLGGGVFAVMKPYDDKTFWEARESYIKSVNKLAKKQESTPAESSSLSLEELEIKAALETDLELTDKLLETLEGYPDLPADWKSLISAEQKQQLFSEAYSFVIDEDEKKFSLGSVVIPTACYLPNATTFSPATPRGSAA